MQYYKRQLEFWTTEYDTECTWPGNSVVRYLYHPAVSSAIRVTQIHDSVSTSWHTTQTLTLTNSEVRSCAPNSCTFCRNAVTTSSTNLHNLCWFTQCQYIAKLFDLKMKTWPRIVWQQPQVSDPPCYTNWYQRSVTLDRSIIRLNETYSTVPHCAPTVSCR